MTYSKSNQCIQWVFSSSRALHREKPDARKVHRLSRKGVPEQPAGYARKARGSALTPEGVNEIVSAIMKVMEWSGMTSRNLSKSGNLT